MSLDRVDIVVAVVIYEESDRKRVLQKIDSPVIRVAIISDQLVLFIWGMMFSLRSVKGI